MPLSTPSRPPPTSAIVSRHTSPMLEDTSKATPPGHETFSSETAAVEPRMISTETVMPDDTISPKSTAYSSSAPSPSASAAHSRMTSVEIAMPDDTTSPPKGTASIPSSPSTGAMIFSSIPLHNFVQLSHLVEVNVSHLSPSSTVQFKNIKWLYFIILLCPIAIISLICFKITRRRRHLSEEIMQIEECRNTAGVYINTTLPTIRHTFSCVLCRKFF